MFRLGKLRTRLLVLILALSVPPFAILGLLAIHQTRQSLQRRVRDEFAARALGRAHAISMWVRERKDDLGQMSDHCFLDPHHAGEMIGWLKKVERTKPCFQGIFILDAEGGVAYSTRPGAEERMAGMKEPLREGLAGDVYVSRPYWDGELESPAILMSAPIPKGEAIVGVIGARLDLSDIEELVSPLHLGESGEIVVVDEEGLILTGSQPRPAGFHRQGATGVFTGDAGGRELVVGENIDHRGIEVVSASSRIPDTDWALVVKQDLAEAHAMVRRLEIMLMLALLGGLGAVVGAATYFSRGISAPLAGLTERAREIGRNELNMREGGRGEDEVTELSHAFQQMVDSLEASREKLQCRQRQLVAANEQLEMLHATDQQRLHILHEITKAASATLKCEEVLRIVLDRTAAHLEASCGEAVLEKTVRPGRERVAEPLRIVWGEAANRLAVTEIEARATRQLMESGQAVLAVEEKAAGWDFPVSVICAPLMLERELAGSVRISRIGGKGAPFSEEDLAFLEAAARQASAAIRNAWLYQSERREKRQLERTRKQLDRLLGEVITAQERERQRIALELHDGPAQGLAVVLRGLEYSRALLEGSNGLENEADRQLDRLMQLARENLTDIRRLLNDLRPTLLDQLGYLAAVRQYCRDFETETGLAAKLEMEGKERALSEEQGTLLFRILQEALANIRKHARARNVLIRMSYGDTQHRLSIIDDGVGFVVHDGVFEGDSLHFGIQGMRERVELLGGRIKFDSVLAGGTRVELEIPYRQGEHELEAAAAGSEHE